MTSRELVKAAIEHRETPRAPYLIQICGDAWDALKPTTGCGTPEEFLDNDVKGIGCPWWDWYELGDDWRGMDAPTSPARVRGHGSYEDIFDSLKQAKDKQDKYHLVMIYGSHFEKAHFARGIENFLADMAGEPAFAQKLLDTIIVKNMVMLDNIVTCEEIDGILLGSDWGTQADLLCSPAAWEEMIRPGEQREYDLIRAYGKDVWIHSCGNIEKIIPALIEMGVDVLNPVQPECMNIEMLKREYGGQLAFWGGISTQRTLPFGTPDEVRAEARYVRDLMGKGGGYVFSPAQSLQSDVPPENIVALLEVARESMK